MREKGRAAIYTMAGFYLLILAYQMFGGRMDNGGSDYAMMLVFSVIFVIVGIGMIGFSAVILKKSTKKTEYGKENGAPEQKLEADAGAEKAEGMRGK